MTTYYHQCPRVFHSESQRDTNDIKERLLRSWMAMAYVVMCGHMWVWVMVCGYMCGCRWACVVLVV